MTDRELMQQALDDLIEAARLLGVTQAKQGFGCYTQEDARFERAMHEAVQKHSTVLRSRLAQPEQEPVAWECKSENLNVYWYATHGMIQVTFE